MSAGPAYQIFDRFLSLEDHAALLTHALASQDRFAPAKVWYHRKERVDPESRMSWKCESGLGPVEERFAAAIHAAAPQALAALGMAEFEVAKTELELVAHR